MDTEVEDFKDEKRYRNFCFTDFVLEESFWANFSNKYDAYVNYGREKCPSTGREHFQGFIHFKNAHKWERIRSIIKPRSLRGCNGSVSQNLVYTDKENREITEFGNRPCQGKRTDLVKLKDEIENGKKVDDITMENPTLFHQYGRTLSKLEDLCMRKKYRTEQTKGIWYFGPTGTGKSHRAFEGFTPDTHYRVKLNDKGWWDGYAQQDTVILNEFRGQIPYSELLELVDKWAFDVPRRGREPMPFTSKTVIVTSSLSPAEVYRNLSQHDSLEQLYRRFDIYRCLSSEIMSKFTPTQKSSEGNTSLFEQEFENDY